MYPIDYNEPQFLEPAHSHDPVQVSHIVPTSLNRNIPTSLNRNIPTSLQDALTGLQESTSIAFASSKRLQALVGERFHRLVPARAELSSSPVNEAGSIKYSEPAFFTYNNQIQAEKRYLLEEALPDWRHKAARVFHENRQCDTKVVFRGKARSQTDFETWWTELQGEVDNWLEEAEDTEIPEFEETVAEYRIFQAKEIKKSLAREKRRSRKITLKLNVPETKELQREDTMDSGIGMDSNSKTEEYGFFI